MEWEFIVAMMLMVPVILLPVALLWYLKTSSIGDVTPAARRSWAASEEGITAIVKKQCFGTGAVSEQRFTHTMLEEVYMGLDLNLSGALEDYPEGGGTVMTTISAPAMPKVDNDGYMLHPKMWTEEIAELLAREMVPEGLTKEHWIIIYYLREYYLKFGIVPPVGMLCRDTGFSLKYIYKLFPGNLPRGLNAGLSKCACKIAGLPWMSFKQYP